MRSATICVKKVHKRHGNEDGEMNANKSWLSGYIDCTKDG